VSCELNLDGASRRLSSIFTGLGIGFGQSGLNVPIAT
jgi:hypothetical protein